MLLSAPTPDAAHPPLRRAQYGRIVRRLATKYSDALGQATDTAQESISNVRTMRSFAGEFVEVRGPKRGSEGALFSFVSIFFSRGRMHLRAACACEKPLAFPGRRLTPRHPSPPSATGD